MPEQVANLRNNASAKRRVAVYDMDDFDVTISNKERLSENRISLACE